MSFYKYLLISSLLSTIQAFGQNTKSINLLSQSVIDTIKQKSGYRFESKQKGLFDIYIGCSGLIPLGKGNSISEMDNIFGGNINLNISIAKWRKNNQSISTGINFGTMYASSLSNHSPYIPIAYNLYSQIQEPSIEVQNSNKKGFGWRISISPYIKLGITKKDFLSFYPSIEYGANSAQGYRIIQTSFPQQGNQIKNTIFERNSNSKGIFLTPKLRFEHFFGWVGLWSEVNYQFGKAYNVNSTTWRPKGEPNKSNESWDIGMFEEGKYTTINNSISNQGLGVNVGIVFKKQEIISTTTRTGKVYN